MTEAQAFANLVILRDYLSANKSILQPRMNMKRYRSQQDLHSGKRITSGCIIGHAVSIIRLKDYVVLKARSIDFDSFAENAFNITRGSYAWAHLFGPTNTDDIDDFLRRLDQYMVSFYQIKLDRTLWTDDIEHPESDY